MGAASAARSVLVAGSHSRCPCPIVRFSGEPGGGGLAILVPSGRPSAGAIALPARREIPPFPASPARNHTPDLRISMRGSIEVQFSRPLRCRRFGPPAGWMYNRCQEARNGVLVRGNRQ